jgi:hypothetical protein
MNPQQNERTLFRFVTLRQPQKSEDQTRASIFDIHEGILPIIGPKD